MEEISIARMALLAGVAKDDLTIPHCLSYFESLHRQIDLSKSINRSMGTRVAELEKSVDGYQKRLRKAMECLLSHNIEML